MIKRQLLVLGCALAAFADRLCGRGLAVNEAPAIPGTLPPETPVVTVGIPTNLDPDKVLARKKALIAAGTEPLLAEKLAIDAEQQQYLRDHHLSVTATVEERPATETVLKLRTHPDGEAEEVDLGSKTVAELTELASTNGYDLKGATKKADIIKAISSAAKAVLVALCCTLFFGAASPAQAGVAPLELVSDGTPLHQADQVIAPAIPYSPMPAAFLAYLTVDAVRWVEVICALALAFAACAWLAKNRQRYRREAVSRFRRALFRVGMFFALIAHRLRGRTLATNVVFTPQQTSHGTASLDGTAAIATKNYVVVRGADDRHFKLVSAVGDVPLGILLNDEIATDEVDVVKKNIALFGLWPESLPAVAEAAIAVDDWLTPGVGTLGRVKTLPTVAGVYWVIGKSRFTVAAAGDPVSIAHCVPFKVVVATSGTVKAGGTLAVPITSRVVVMTTGGAEALTLANGVPGQRLNLVLGVDGGDGTLTPATKTGFTSIVFADAGDIADLEYVDDVKGWILVGTAGVAAPPVIVA